ncbi:hypothetical protein M427DRAFT_57794 [Gonapodya prolifera JEL478]|uniref:Uncharacterized protein n=1 Tax=Gonapodya prolifera (strain JEL478) TaxID=1344416 RepID=A0A139ABY1_GONPJ|nr:hypothetical protein M427DRAFT_57794 [Gonapodya prolifera JEL478]|eukprot:KXS14306.1 hypothetical protein M427DRAFT_57794 [Gonapodya prolifera JEL478]
MGNTQSATPPPAPPPPPAKTVCYNLEGFLNCSYLESASAVARRTIQIEEKRRFGGEDGKPDQSAGEPGEHGIVNVVSTVRQVAKPEWRANRVAELNKLAPPPSDYPKPQHTSSPFIYEGCTPSEYKFIGGASDFVKLVQKRHRLPLPQAPKA